MSARGGRGLSIGAKFIQHVTISKDEKTTESKRPKTIDEMMREMEARNKAIAEPTPRRV